MGVIEEFRKRRAGRLAARKRKEAFNQDASARLAYGICKEHGIETGGNGAR